ncbi:F6'H1: Feruloyl CoA ortho-hydroxylase 1 [Bienertia sinuspersici]
MSETRVSHWSRVPLRYFNTHHSSSRRCWWTLCSRIDGDNGKYKSVEHLVVANGLRNRVSIPIFVGSTPNSIIGSLQDMLNEEEEHNSL